MRGLCWLSALAISCSSFMAFAGTVNVPLIGSKSGISYDPVEDSEPIDVVYTWVDGSDPAWKKQRKYFVGKIEGMSKSAIKRARFRSHDELKYSLRSIQAFAPFVRHIYIVTSGQKPKWLADHPKITIVTHDEIFSKKEFLPTFNSIAIEANLHHIKGLSSRYIYFNDDVFLGKPVTRHDFYAPDRKIKVFSSGRSIFTEKQNDNKKVKYRSWEIPYQNMANYMMKELAADDKPPKKEFFFYHSHTPFPMFKRIAQATERRFHCIFKRASSHKFRMDKDVTITNGLIPHYALHINEAEVVAADSITFLFRAESDNDQKGLKTILKKRPMFFCIQDSAEKTSKASERYLRKFFEKYFPQKAPWEKGSLTNKKK